MKGVFLPILFLALLLLLSVSSGRELNEDRNENNPKHDQLGPIARGFGHLIPHVIPHLIPHPPPGKRGYSTPGKHAEFVKAHGVPRN